MERKYLNIFLIYRISRSERFCVECAKVNMKKNIDFYKYLEKIIFRKEDLRDSHCKNMAIKIYSERGRVKKIFECVIRGKEKKKRGFRRE